MTSIIPLKKEGCVDEILPHLYLGDIETAQDESILQKLDIKHIINLSNTENYQKWPGITYLDINVDDSRNVDLSTFFPICNKLIDRERNNRENILVHCVSGVSRSVTIILSYLMHKGMTLKGAFMYLNMIRKRQYTLPNIGFFKQLQKCEEKVSMTMSQYMSMRNTQNI